MKKIAFTFFVFILSVTSQAQVQLLHTFDGAPSLYGDGIMLDPFPDHQSIYEPVDSYVVLSDDGIKIYDNNFSLLKTIPVSVLSSLFNCADNTFTPTSFHFQIQAVLGRHIINPDEKIEMLLSISAYGEDEYGYDDLCSDYMIINEDGELIFDFQHYVNYLNIHKAGNQLRMAAWTQGYCIYSLGGNYNPSTMVTYTQPSSSLNPYPNPSRNTITLPYTLQSGETTQLRVFNMSGQLLETFNVGSDFDKIELNVSDYAKGTYIYTYNGVSKKFVVR